MQPLVRLQFDLIKFILIIYYLSKQYVGFGPPDTISPEDLHLEQIGNKLVIAY